LRILPLPACNEDVRLCRSRLFPPPRQYSGLWHFFLFWVLGDWVRHFLPDSSGSFLVSPVVLVEVFRPTGFLRRPSHLPLPGPSPCGSSHAPVPFRQGCLPLPVFLLCLSCVWSVAWGFFLYRRKRSRRCGLLWFILPLRELVFLLHFPPPPTKPKVCFCPQFSPAHPSYFLLRPSCVLHFLSSSFRFNGYLVPEESSPQ